MSKQINYKSFELVIVDRNGAAIVVCKDHQKRLETYRQVRSHFKKFHELDEYQFQTISRMGYRLFRGIK